MSSTKRRPCHFELNEFNIVAIIGNMKYICIFCHYRQVSNIRRTWVGNEIVDHSDVVGASPVGAAPTHSPLNTWLQYIVRRQLQVQSRNI